MSYLFLGRSGSSTLVVSDSRTSLVCDGYGCPHLQGFVALSAIILSRLSKHFWKPRGTHKSQSRFAVVKAIDVCGISASSHVDSRSVIIAWHKGTDGGHQASQRSRNACKDKGKPSH